jgi:putrescine aminotransferase
MRTSKEVFDGFIERSWRANAQRQRDKGIEFVIGKRDGAYLWNMEGTHRVIDCGTAGGVHSVGHANRRVANALRRALDEGRDTGLWSLPNAEYLKLQDSLRELAPASSLTRSVVTHCSTLSVDLAVMVAFRATDRGKIVAYRHGYHGHTGFAALVTGSPEEGVLDHYHLPQAHTCFFEHYGSVSEIEQLLTKDVAALILEPINYETFEAAAPEFLSSVSAACRNNGTLLILDETRTGIGRTGTLWAAEHYPGLEPDLMIVGKGLSGGLYPVSAVMMREDIYEKCINSHKFAYLSSLGGNEIACIVAQEVLAIASDSAFLAHSQHLARNLKFELDRLVSRFPEYLTEAKNFGAIASLGLADPAMAASFYREAFREGVLCHSTSLVNSASLKFLPALVTTDEQVSEIGEVLSRAITRVIHDGKEG